ncbi:MAG: hypothetical protein HC849_14740 [Oscillatoriales cyanobacterium RU_3_3]|nr:hypothetical protein [Microcoleus sp. SM1_3_4]NJM61176.1 hypothetical protein [Oscillatoriales cyanobacterium RU_3_3]NJR23421.1 hypothetical protein [Richelia sp. CSU_2_1]
MRRRSPQTSIDRLVSHLTVDRALFVNLLVVNCQLPITNYQLYYQLPITNYPINEF